MNPLSSPHLRADLMRPYPWGSSPIVLCQLKAAARARIGWRLSARHSADRVGCPTSSRASWSSRPVCRHGSISTICGPPAYGCRSGGARRATPPTRTEPGFLPRLGDVILTHLAGSPAGDVQEFVIHREVDVGHQRRHCANPCRRGGSWSLLADLGRDRRRLLDVELAAFAPPGPDRAFEVRGVDHDA